MTVIEKDPLSLTDGREEKECNSEPNTFWYTSFFFFHFLSFFFKTVSKHEQKSREIPFFQDTVFRYFMHANHALGKVQ